MLEFSRPKLSEGRTEWYIYYRVKDSITGQWILRKTRGGINRIKLISDRRRYAIGILRELEKQLAGGIDPAVEEIRPRLPLSETLQAIIQGKKTVLRPRTIQSYTHAKNKLLKFLKAEYPNVKYMEDMTRSVAQGFIQSLYNSGLEGYTINGTKDCLKAVFNVWVDQAEEHSPRMNPFRGIPKAKQKIGRNLAFTPEIRSKLWNLIMAKSPELYLFTRCMYFTFLRPVELLRLRVQDVRMDLGEIIIQGPDSKNARRRSVVIPGAFMKELAALNLQEYPPTYFLFGRNLVPSEHSLHRNRVTERHRPFLKALGLPKDYTLYSWKATGAIAAYQAGIDLYSIMRQMRHHSLEQTQDYLKSLGLVKNTEFGEKMR